jgi:NAD(P)-dependent dehydrogenase (short-subunit alcohol dehydrogenase family)
MRNVAVIGASRAGVECARNLARAGIAVTLFDRAGSADIAADIDGLNLFCECHVFGLARYRGAWCVNGDATSLGPFDAAIIALGRDRAAAMIGLHDLQMGRKMFAPEEPALWNPEIRLGCCGGWMNGIARLSGLAMANCLALDREIEVVR